MEVQYSIVKSNDYNGKLQQRLDDYKDEYTQMIKKYKLVKGNAEARAANGQSAKRAQLMAGNQQLDQSTSVLENSRKILYDTEKLGDTVLGDLESQREKLLYAQEKVQDTSSITFSAKNVLRQMGNRAIRQKICIYFTILVLFIIIGLILYYGVYKKYYS